MARAEILAHPDARDLQRRHDGVVAEVKREFLPLAGLELDGIDEESDVANELALIDGDEVADDVLSLEASRVRSKEVVE